MNLFENYYKQIIKQDYINKFKIKIDKPIPKLKKITLNFGCRNTSIQKLAVTILALEIITQKKSSITISKNLNISLKIQKGQPSGCKVELENKKIYSFIKKLNLEILPKLKHFSKFKIQKQKFNFFFQIPGNKIQLQEFENNYPLFHNLPMLDINISTNSTNEDEILFLAKSMKLPILKMKKNL